MNWRHRWGQIPKATTRNFYFNLKGITQTWVQTYTSHLQAQDKSLKGSLRLHFSSQSAPSCTTKNFTPMCVDTIAFRSKFCSPPPPSLPQTTIPCSLFKPRKPSGPPLGRISEGCFVSLGRKSQAPNTQSVVQVGSGLQARMAPWPLGLSPEPLLSFRGQDRGTGCSGLKGYCPGLSDFKFLPLSTKHICSSQWDLFRDLVSPNIACLDIPSAQGIEW